MSDTLIALLAAGKAERFGGGKLDAMLRGKSLGLWSLLAAKAIDLPLIVITGASPLRFVEGGPQIVNPDAEQGIGTSIRLAAREAQEAGARRLLLADMPFVSPETLRALIAATEPDSASACVYPDGALGPPACFGAGSYPLLRTIAPDRGANAVLRQIQNLSRITPPAHELIDIDTRAELRDNQAPDTATG